MDMKEKTGLVFPYNVVVMMLFVFVVVVVRIIIQGV